MKKGELEIYSASEGTGKSLMNCKFVYRAILGFYGYDSLYERLVIAKNIEEVKEFALKQWPTAEVRDVEYIDIAHGEDIDSPGKPIKLADWIADHNNKLSNP